MLVSIAMVITHEFEVITCPKPTIPTEIRKTSDRVKIKINSNALFLAMLFLITKASLDPKATNKPSPNKMP